MTLLMGNAYGPMQILMGNNYDPRHKYSFFTLTSVFEIY